SGRVLGWDDTCFGVLATVSRSLLARAARHRVPACSNRRTDLCSPISDARASRPGLESRATRLDVVCDRTDGQYSPCDWIRPSLGCGVSRARGRPARWVERGAAADRAGATVFRGAKYHQPARRLSFCESCDVVRIRTKTSPGSSILLRSQINP